MRNIVLIVLLLAAWHPATANESWYEQGKFMPVQRLEFTISNTLDIDRENAAVVIRREDFPQPDQHEMWVTVVDPGLPPFEGPSEELLRLQGGHQLRAEKNGHAVFHQMDDLDKDGIWDELFFQTDIKANSKKTIYIYLGENIRGWNTHYTHANIGSYARHLMPFWESENVGWKIWFANAVDVYAKRKPMLMSQRLYMENLDGYGVSAIDPNLGSDIQRVAASMGGGAIGLFEDKQNPEVISLPRFTPVKQLKVPKSGWNAGQIGDTRYAYQVVVNGPVRSIIRIKGMNWDSGQGFYEYEQDYTVYAKQSYTTSKVVFKRFEPRVEGVKFAAGFRKKPEENHFIQEGGLIVSSGPEEIRDPENIDDRKAAVVPFIGTALIVRDEYLPQYHYIDNHNGNHSFAIADRGDHGFEFLLSSAWSEGAVYNNAKDFTAYVRKTAREYNHPLRVEFSVIENKE